MLLYDLRNGCIKRVADKSDKNLIVIKDASETHDVTKNMERRSDTHETIDEVNVNV